jgi:renalase
MQSRKKIGIIGAGISGLVAAEALSKHFEVVIFEKSRGVGGRMATRCAEPYYFDHGAQCFTATTKEFREFLSPFIKDNIISEWSGKVINLEIGKDQTERKWKDKHYVASPNMNSLCKYLSTDLDIRKNTEVAPLKVRKSDKWVLEDISGNKLGEFDLVISTAPPAQTTNLFKEFTQNPVYAKSNMQSCFALMIGLNRKWARDWIAAKVINNPIKWISVNSSKPNRNSDVTSLVVHSRSNWAKRYLEEEKSEIQKKLLLQLSLLLKEEIKPDFAALHRWKYAIVGNPSRLGNYYDSNLGLAATSDWCATSRIEEVYLSAMNLIQKLN